MKKGCILAIITLVALTFTSALAFAEDTLMAIQKRGVLRIGTDPGYMPFELINKKGEIIGFDIDIAKQMAKAMNVKLEIVSTAWDGIIPALMTDKFDVIMGGMTVTQERNLSINFSDPYLLIGQSILIRKELAGEVKSYMDLNDPKYTVAGKIGTTGAIATKKMISKAKYISYDTEQEGVMEVVNGKVDAFIYDLPFNSIAANQKGQGKIIHLDQPFTHEPLACGIRRSDPNFINWLNNFMSQLKYDGKYDKIYDKWFKSDVWLKEIQ